MGPMSLPLQAALLFSTCILLVSNTAVHQIGVGTCAWTIWTNTKLWSREGYAPGPLTDMYSGLVEAYGIYAVLHFFSHYLQLYSIIFPGIHLIHIYCDNNEQVQGLTSTPYPHEAIHDDYPIFQEIQTIIYTLYSFWASFHHVKGHQRRQQTINILSQSTWISIAIPMHQIWTLPCWHFHFAITP